MAEEEKNEPKGPVMPAPMALESNAEPPPLNATATSIAEEPQAAQTHQMEIHHPHKPHHPKAWNEYIFEGLMIFVAVTLGFFAEQLRERVVETHREKEYMQSLLNDFRIDTFTLQRTIDEKRWIIAKFDSVQKILQSGELAKNNEFIYYVERYITLNDVFTSQDVSYQELRSSGNFRYMKNISLYKKIADYYNLYSRYQDVDGSFGQFGKDEMSELESKLFNGPDLSSLNNEYPNTFYDLVKRPESKKFQPINPDKQLLNHLYIKIDNAKQRSSNYSLLNALKEKALEIMKELKEEYDLNTSN